MWIYRFVNIQKHTPPDMSMLELCRCSGIEVVSGRIGMMGRYRAKCEKTGWEAVKPS